MSIDITVPALGESVSTATVARWLKKAGDSVKADEPLVALETDKVTVEVNAPAAGVLAVLAAEGEDVAVGAVLGQISEGAGVPVSSGTAARAEPTPPPLPAARKLMTERQIAASDIGSGAGKDGRITKGDVLAFLDRQPPASAPSAPAAPPLPQKRDEAREERVKMTRLRRTIAARLKEAQNTAAMLTTFNEVDMSAAMAMRTEYKDLFEKTHEGARLGFMSFFVRACVAALRAFPAVNAAMDGDEIVYKNYVDMGIAVGGPNGLVVPVLRDAHRLSFAAIERQIADFGKRARNGTLTLDDLTGGTFSITNGGVYGSLMSTPILNPPQSGILGMHKIQDRPVVVNGVIVIRPMMYLALSYDHRVVDGKEAVSFLVRVKEAVEDPRRLLLEV